MPENINPAQPVGREKPTSTTEEVLRLLCEQPHALNDDDVLSNPELEQLLGSLSKGLEEEGIPDSLLGPLPTVPLTLEDLAAGLGQPLARGEIPLARSAREAVVACAACGSANPASTRFCGMCGRELGQASSAGKASGNGSEPTAAVRAVPDTAASRSSGRGWKIACLTLLGCVLGLVVYQQQVWRLPWLRDWIPSLLTAPAVPPPLAAPPTPASLPDAPGPDSVERPLPAVRPPNPAAHPPKTAGSTPASPAAVTPSEAAPTGESSAAPSPSVVNRELPERAPAIPAPAAPIGLPAIIKPPSASPVLQSARAPAPAHESTSPPVTRVSQVTPGALIFKVNPQYPPAARSARIQGSVVMRAVIGTDGSVQQLRLVSGNPLLVSAAMEAVRMWRYRPFLLDGKPVEGETNITVNFKGE